MATFQATGTGTTGASSYTLKLVVNEDSYSIANNSSSVSWALYLESTGYNFSQWGFPITANVDGEVYNSSAQRSISKNSTLTIASGSKTIYHNDNGQKSISCSASCSATGAYYLPGNISVSGTMNLTTIPRYPSGCSISFNSKTLNSIKINWSCNQNCKQVQYRLNGGGWVNTMSGGSKSSGNFNITGLTYNTKYKIECDFQRADSELWSSWDSPPNIPSIDVTTYDIAKVTNAPNINLGDNPTITVSNPGSASIKVYVEIINPTETVTIKTGASGDNTFNFTDAELDKIFKKMGTGNSTTIRFGVATNDSYWHWLDRTCTLTGNQKTSHIKISNSWKRGKTWIKVNNSWKRGVVWEKVNDTWKRCI